MGSQTDDNSSILITGDVMLQRGQGDGFCLGGERGQERGIFSTSLSVLGKVQGLRALGLVRMFKAQENNLFGFK